jgi:hypothetical protein
MQRRRASDSALQVARTRGGAQAQRRAGVMALIPRRVVGRARPRDGIWVDAANVNPI